MPAQDTTGRCVLCGSSVGDGDTAPAFCSGGCQAVAEELGDGPSMSGDRTGDANPGLEEGLERTYLRIDGTYSATCEAILEEIAKSQDGVDSASASYVTETIRIDYDPGRVSVDDLESALETLGYTPYRRDEAADGEDDRGGTRRSREMTGLKKRRSEDVLEMRYIVGVVFGTFLLVPYMTVFYPVQAAEYVDWGVLGLYAEAFGTFDGTLAGPLFLTVTTAVLYLAGMPLLRGAYISLKLRRPNTHLLATLTIVAAYGYGTIAFAYGRADIYYDLTIVVAALVVGAIFYESIVKRRATARLTDLTISQVTKARRLEADGTATVSVESLEAGDRVLVREGERIPVDGILADDGCTVEEAVVTGESLPIAKTPGDPVIGGSVVRTDAATVIVEQPTSSIDRLTERVWDVQSAAHGVSRRADDLAAMLTPAVFGIVVAVGIGSLVFGSTVTATLLAILLAALAVSPWGLAFAPPLTVAENVREAAEEGVIVFDETIFERLRSVDVVVFDKTGTLTTGEMTVHTTDAPEDLLVAGAALEDRAAHPAATAIAEAVDVPSGLVEEFHSYPAGVGGLVDGDRILVGHPDCFVERGWTIPTDIEERVDSARKRGLLPIVLGRNDTAEGVAVLGDEPRRNWESVVSRLSELGLEVVVLTGDDESGAAFLGAHPAVDHVFAAVPPAGKMATVERLCADNCVAMVGDGTNDAPALAAADLGISLGGGTALAADAADLAIVDDDLAGVERAFELAATARTRVSQNLALALSYNVVAISLALVGVLTPLFATAGVALTAILVAANASRPLLDG